MFELNGFTSALNRFKCRPGKFMSGLKKFTSELNLIHLKLEIVQARA